MIRVYQRFYYEVFSPYSRFFITTKVDISISFGVFCLIIASITFFIDRDNNIFFFLFFYHVYFLHLHF
ncbi:unnamed protein product [Commensalibacter communis]|nr:unnamed protein product [Commensalibacter communis]CAI3929192.1 unnamed protein product [Commensalibacter communis]